MTKRWVGAVGVFGLIALAMFLTGASPAGAQGTDVVWVTNQIPWSDKVGTAFTGSAKDTAFITDENDTTRTDFVDTKSWAWESMRNGTAALNMAYVTLTCRTNNGAADSVYYSIEKRVRGVTDRNRTLVVAVGACALLQGDARASNAIYKGVLSWDPDSPETLNLIAPGDEFRLVVQGDQGGTTPKMSQCRVYVTYPARRASTP